MCHPFSACKMIFFRGNLYEVMNGGNKGLNNCLTTFDSVSSLLLKDIQKIFKKSVDQMLKTSPNFQPNCLNAKTKSMQSKNHIKNTQFLICLKNSFQKDQRIVQSHNAQNNQFRSSIPANQELYGRTCQNALKSSYHFYNNTKWRIKKLCKWPSIYPKLAKRESSQPSKTQWEIDVILKETFIEKIKKSSILLLKYF